MLFGNAFPNNTTGHVGVVTAKDNFADGGSSEHVVDTRDRVHVIVQYPHSHLGATIAAFRVRGNRGSDPTPGVGISQTDFRLQRALPRCDASGEHLDRWIEPLSAMVGREGEYGKKFGAYGTGAEQMIDCQGWSAASLTRMCAPGLGPLRSRFQQETEAQSRPSWATK